MKKGLNELAKEMYKLNRNTEYRMGEICPYGSYTRQSFIGIIYVGNSSDSFSDITDIERYLSFYPGGINMLYLSSSVETSELQVYDYEYKEHRVEGDYLIIETTRGEKKLKLKNTVDHNFNLCKSSCSECNGICIDKVAEDIYICRHTAKRLKAISEDTLEVQGK